MPEFLLPFGPFHIVLLHLPIGVLAAILFVEVFLRDKDDRKLPALGMLYFLFVLTTAFAIGSGLIYEKSGKFGDEVEDHERWGFIFGACALVTYVLSWVRRKKKNPGVLAVYVVALIATTGAMVVTGHLGGELVHGKGFLTKGFKSDERPAPPPPKESSSNEPPQTSTTVSSGVTPSVLANSERMDSQVMTIAAVDPKVALFNAAHAVLERNCFECHGATKQKGDYRVDSAEAIMTVGRGRKEPVVAGDPNASELYYRILLPADDDDVMPPSKKPRLSPQAIEAVHDWIAAGAYWPTQAELDAAKGSHSNVGTPATDKAIATINQTGAKAEYNAWGDGSVRVDLGVVFPEQLGTALQAIGSLKSELIWLDCSKLKLPNGFFNGVTRFENLERLHLDGTNVTDTDLAALGQLPKLKYLNLYDTQVSDQGLATIEQLYGLEKLFLSGTKVSEPAVESLRRNRPEIDVVYRK
ncbi:MAG: c-type cytochrome domain-containing protein [Verrucomicrobiota bacterium]